MTKEEQLMQIARAEANQSTKLVGCLVLGVLFILIPILCGILGLAL